MELPPLPHLPLPHLLRSLLPGESEPFYNYVLSQWTRNQFIEAIGAAVIGNTIHEKNHGMLRKMLKCVLEQSPAEKAIFLQPHPNDNQFVFDISMTFSVLRKEPESEQN